MDDPQETAQVIVDKVVTIFQNGGLSALAPYIAQVLEWNRSLSLVSRKDPAGACERLLLESVELDQVLGVGQCGRVADVGSGAGFPGLVWALLYPRVHFLLIERREKRALFLERTCRQLHVTNVNVEATDLRDIAAADRFTGAFDIVSSIAVGELVSTGALAQSLLDPAGRFASTVSRETPPPATIGEHLHLERHVEGKFGCYVTYRSGV